MDRRALDDALEGGSRHRFGTFDIGFECRQILVDEIDQRFAQGLDIHAAGLHDLLGFGLVDQRKQQMLKRGKGIRH